MVAHPNLFVREGIFIYIMRHEGEQSKKPRAVKLTAIW